MPQHDQYTPHLPPTIQGTLLKQRNNLESVNTVLKPHLTPSEPHYHQLSHQHIQPWVDRQETFTGLTAPGIVLDMIGKLSCSIYMYHQVVFYIC